MKVLGLIAEYNPFHLGHKHHIEEARKLYGADYVIVVMSGNYVQRGTPAIMDKYSRARMALKAGADLVFELPTCYATASANLFALGAVALLDKLSIVNFLCFGSESGDITAFKDLSSLMVSQSNLINKKIYEYTKEGNNFPIAREKAITELLIDMGLPLHSLTLIQNPNNILGLEYLKAIQTLNSDIEPLTIKRFSGDYHDDTLANSFNSATAIRKVLENASKPLDLEKIKSSVPRQTFEILCQEFDKSQPVCMEDFSLLIKYKILSSDPNDLSQYLDITPDLANRIKNQVGLHNTMAKFSQDLNSKNNTLTRINRCLLHMTLTIVKSDFSESMGQAYMPYARVLGMKASSSFLLGKIKEKTKIPIITKLSRGESQIEPEGLKMFNNDIWSSHLYNQVVYEKFKHSLPREYIKNMIVI